MKEKFAVEVDFNEDDEVLIRQPTKQRKMRVFAIGSASFMFVSCVEWNFKTAIQPLFLSKAKAAFLLWSAFSTLYNSNHDVEPLTVNRNVEISLNGNPLFSGAVTIREETSNYTSSLECRNWRRNRTFFIFAFLGLKFGMLGLLILGIAFSADDDLDHVDHDWSTVDFEPIILRPSSYYQLIEGDVYARTSEGWNHKMCNIFVSHKTWT